MQVAVFLMRSLKGFIWLIPVAAIALWGISELVKKFLDHRERQALIERGIDPDSVKKGAPTLR
jgi:hypothetical protein